MASLFTEEGQLRTLLKCPAYCSRILSLSLISIFLSAQRKRHDAEDVRLDFFKVSIEFPQFMCLSITWILTSLLLGRLCCTWCSFCPTIALYASFFIVDLGLLRKAWWRHHFSSRSCLISPQFSSNQSVCFLVLECWVDQLTGGLPVGLYILVGQRGRFQTGFHFLCKSQFDDRGIQLGNAEMLQTLLMLRASFGLALIV